jgi:hypothetical protein
MDAGTLELFENELRKEVPDFQVKFKDESWLQKVIGVLMYPINPQYMTGYITTFGSTVYFGSRADYLSSPDGTFSTLAHEFVHIVDSKKDGLFRLKYIFPQVLVLIPLLVYAILAGAQAWLLALPVLGYVIGAILCRKSRIAFIAAVAIGVLSMVVLGWWLTGWKLLVMLGLVLVGPWPSSWRREYELRGYGMNVAIFQWRNGDVSKEAVNFFVQQFTGPAYFYMCRDVAYLERTFEATRQQAQAGALQKIPPYGLVYDFLRDHRFLFRAA